MRYKDHRGQKLKKLLKISVVNSNCKIRIFRRISKKNIKNRFENLFEFRKKLK